MTSVIPTLSRSDPIANLSVYGDTKDEVSFTLSSKVSIWFTLVTGVLAVFGWRVCAIIRSQVRPFASIFLGDVATS